MLSNRVHISGGVVRVTLVTLAALGLLVWLRGDALLAPGMINPDEAELLAEGKRAMMSLVPYRDYTGTTHLFLWPLALGLLGKLGFALALPTAHFLSGIAYLYLVLVGWYTLSRYVHWLYALACITPAALVLFTANAMSGPEYLSLGTELLPVVLLTGALHLVHTGSPLRWRFRLALAAVLIGASVTAKPQALPLAVGFLVACVAAVCAQSAFAADAAGTVNRRSLRAPAVWALLWSLVPLISAVAWMAAGHTLRAFFEEPVAFQIDYVFRREHLQAGGISPAVRERLTGVGEFLGAIPLSFLVLVGAGDARSGPVLFSREWPPGRRRAALVVLFGVTLSAVFTVAAVWPLFPHYGNFVYAGCILAAVSSCAMLGPRSARQVTTRSDGYRTAAPIVVPALVLSLLLVASTALDGSRHDNMRWGALRHPSQAVSDAAGAAERRLRSQCPTGERVMVWGWAAELYSYNDWTPPTRYVDSAWQLWSPSKRPVYVRRLVHELTTSPPTCVVDAVGPTFFGSFGADRGIAATLPELTGLLRRCYVEQTVEPSPTNRLTYYVRRDACGSRTA